MLSKRLPKFIRLPGGFIIEVKQRKLSGEYGNWSYCLEANCGLIKIDQRLDLARKYRILAHELLHGLTDYSHWLDLKARELETQMGRTAADLREDD
jgi:hypothetical protein